MKNPTNFVVAPIANAKHKWLLTTGDPQKFILLYFWEALEVY